MKNKFKELKANYINAKTEDEKEFFRNEIRKFNAENPDIFGDLMIEDIKNTNSDLKKILK